MLDDGRYAGTTPFAQDQFKRQLPGQPEESFATKAPFTKAIDNSISYIKENKGKNSP